MKMSHCFNALLVALLGVCAGCATGNAPAKEAEKAVKPAAKAEAKPAAKAAAKKAAKPAAKKAAVKPAAKAAAKPAAKAAVKPAAKPAAKAPAKKAPGKLTLEQEIKLATTPVQYTRHAKRHADKKAFAAANKGKIKILMLGDSITHQWESKSAVEAQKKYLAPYGVLNLGCGGDRTQHTLWIMEKSGILELIKPQLVTIMIGTNNRGNYKATVAGIKRIVEGVQKRYPEAKILLYAIFPRGADSKNARRIENEKVNAEIVKFCNGKNVIWVDIRKNFLKADGTLTKEMMPDYLHPRNYKGYSVWGESLKPYFEKYGK